MITAVAIVLLFGAVVLLLNHNRPARATTDLHTACRAVSPWWNASAIGAEYISTAAFLGVTGLVLANGIDMLWLPVGAVSGYVMVLALVIVPLRRSGAYTLSDFAEWRLESRAARLAVCGCVVVIGWLYLLPQFLGAGATMSVITGLPRWTGWALVVLVVGLLLLSGGIGSITGVQAVQFWLKLVAVAIPALAFLMVWRPHGLASAAETPAFHRPTSVAVDADVALRVDVTTQITVTGVLDGRRYRAERVRVLPGRYVVRTGARLGFSAGAPVPHAERVASVSGDAWLRPFAGQRDHPLVATYSLLLGMALGTMGLPHVVVRFYTNSSGRTARRTAGIVVGLIAVFGFFPWLFGALGREYVPEVLVTGETDAALLLLPQRVLPGVAGDLVTALVTTGAFAAFISSSCGIVMAVSGTISQCRFGGGLGSYRLGAAVAMSVPLLLAPCTAPVGSAPLVTIAFATSASSLCPLLVLGVWWRRLTPVGAIFGLVAGTTSAGVAGLTRIMEPQVEGWSATLTGQPALVSVPIGFATMIGVSLLTSSSVPRSTARAMARLHLPEELLLRPSR